VVESSWVNTIPANAKPPSRVPSTLMHQAADVPPLLYLLTNASIVPPIESSPNLMGLTFTVTDSLINHDEIEGGVAVASPCKGKICLDSKMSCFLFCFGKLMVYLILLCNNRHLWLKPSRKRRLPRNPPRGPKMVTFRVTSITNSGAGFSCRHYVKLVKKLSPERFDSLATGLMKATHNTIDDLEVIEIDDGDNDIRANTVVCQFR